MKRKNRERPKSLAPRLLQNILILMAAVAAFLIIFEIFFPEQYAMTQVRIIQNVTLQRAYVSDGVPLWHFDLSDTLLSLPPKQPGKIRIFTIGDSFTYGHGVERNQTYSYYLEDMLNKAYGPGRFEVINAGVPGYDLDQVHEVYKEILDHQPDMIIYGIFINDLDGVIKVKHEKDRILVISYRDDAPYFPGVPFSRELTSLKIVRLINTAIVQTHLVPEKAVKYYKPNLARYLSIIQGMHDTARSRDIAFMGFVIPDLGRCGRPYYYTEEPLFYSSFMYSGFVPDLINATGNNCASLRINEYRAYDPFAQGHPTPEGHRVFAQLLFDRLKAYNESLMMLNSAR